VGAAHVTLLIEHLRRLATDVSPELRFPSLEKVWSRGRSCQSTAVTPDHLRFSLFGIEPEGSLPVAALTHVSDHGARVGKEYYWLRADPVTLCADMSRVFMTSHGFGDLDANERNEIELCVQSVLRNEGLDLHSDHPERWCIALGRPLEFGFTPLEEALGRDLGDALPGHPTARYWRRLLNETQVALHNCPVNVRRRTVGRQEVNSVWFWGGGFVPDAAPQRFVDAVFSDHPVSRGLAIINGCRVKERVEVLRAGFSDEGHAVLVDWVSGPGSAEQELAALDTMTGSMLVLCDAGRLTLTLYDGQGYGRTYNRGARRRFWRRRVPLKRAMESDTE